MRVGIDARRQAHQEAARAGVARPGDLLDRVQDDERARLGGAAQQLILLVVAVDDDLLASDPRGQGEGQLARGRDVGAEALLGQQAENRDRRERLRPVDHEGIRRGRPIRPRLRANGRLVVDDERRPEPFDELRRAQSSDRQLAVDDGGRVGQELCKSRLNRWLHAETIVTLGDVSLLIT